MALPNRLLTEDEAHKFLADWRTGEGHAIASLWDEFVTFMHADLPRPHVVHYTPYGGATYIPSTSHYYYWSKAPASPSDCTWIVPGSEREI